MGKLNAKLPPDVTHKEFSLEYFTEVLAKSGRPIKLVLMDQDKLGGVGNIYANDALYLARINPKRKARELAEKERAELYGAVKKVINLGIKYGGASVDKYVDAAGMGGKYQEHFLVYGRNGQKCKRDGNVIRKVKLGGRGPITVPAVRHDLGPAGTCRFQKLYQPEFRFFHRCQCRLGKERQREN